MEAQIKDMLAGAVSRLAGSSITPELDARVLLQHCLDREPAWLMAHASDLVDEDRHRIYAGHVERRRHGEPIAYITGSKEFWSLPLSVNDTVLIPRPETEHLVEHALARIPAQRRWRIADLGTGSGAVALAIARERPQSRVTATDISPAALGTARDNAHRLHIRNVDFLLGDWFDALGTQRFDMVVSNPPYVADHDKHLGAAELTFEPELALRAGREGLDALSTIVAHAQDSLSGQGWLLLEHGHDQQEPVARLLREHAFGQINCYRDYAGRPRVTACRVATTT